MTERCFLSIIGVGSNRKAVFRVKYERSEHCLTFTAGRIVTRTSYCVSSSGDHTTLSSSPVDPGREVAWPSSLLPFSLQDDASDGVLGATCGTSSLFSWISPLCNA